MMGVVIEYSAVGKLPACRLVERRRGRAIALAVALVATMGLGVAPVSAHDCGATGAKPSCVDYGYIFIQPPAQTVMSRPLGHYCEDGKEMLTTRIEVTFSDVTQHAAHLDKITVYFDGDHEFHLGALDAYGPKNEFHYEDHETSWQPGSHLSLYPAKKVDLGDGAFVVAHKPWRGMIGGTPGVPGGVIIPCGGPPHEFLVRVREHQERDPCRGVKPPGPC
jgi:hypothetical protein